MHRRLVLRGATLVLVFALAVPLQPPLAAAQPDLWAKVPAFPTGCYQTSDDFPARLAAADEALTRDLERQKAINTELSEELKSIDPMELAGRQQKYMMAHPQEAMEMMQRNQALGQDTVGAEQKNADAKQALLEELDGVDARYRAELDGVLKPLEAKLKDLDVRASKDAGIQTEAGAYTGWALAEYTDLIRQENAAYEKVCLAYWGASGPFHGWMKRYREHLVKDQIPHREEAEAVGAGFIVMVISTPEKTWQSTATLMAVNEYADLASKVFSKRRLEPRKTEK